VVPFARGGPMEDRWQEGETAVLRRAGDPPRLLRVVRGVQPVGTEGVIDLTDEVGQEVGRKVSWSGTSYTLLRPSLADLLTTLRRNAQIVTAKDAVHLLYLAGVGPGARVAEAGSGSGALTIAIAFAVGPAGHVTSFDRRADFLSVARANVERAGMLERVSFRERDVASDGIDLTDLSSVVLDLPEPWAVLASARSALRPGGYAATYTPTYNQLERTVRSFRDLGFDEVRAVEVLERGLHVGEGGTRPDFEMLGHTGFLASGRRVD
jgi:tRNA (adenine57-N1/adenine58-N1)-methyltransferase catalytic subunit